MNSKNIWHRRLDMEEMFKEMMDGKVYDLVDMDTLEKMPRICEYREED